MRLIRTECGVRNEPRRLLRNGTGARAGPFPGLRRGRRLEPRGRVWSTAAGTLEAPVPGKAGHLAWDSPTCR